MKGKLVANRIACWICAKLAINSLGQMSSRKIWWNYLWHEMNLKLWTANIVTKGNNRWSHQSDNMTNVNFTDEKANQYLF